MSKEKECPSCHGGGMLFNPHINIQPMTCPACNGKGIVTELKEFEKEVNGKIKKSEEQV